MNELNAYKERSPSKEQNLAIKHNGGVILSAGAGSGKTFVLVEHIIYLIEKFFFEKKEAPEISRRTVRSFFSSIVMMTFTTKAAGEFKQRLEKRIKEKIKNASDNHSQNMWSLSLENFTSLNIGTIHSFCYQLIARGYFPSLPSSIKITTELEYKQHLENLYNRWFKFNSDDISSLQRELLLSQHDKIIHSLSHIFSSPELRTAWLEIDVESSLMPEAIEQTIHEIFKILKINTSFFDRSAVFDLKNYSEHKGKAWYKNIELINESIAKDLPGLSSKMEALGVTFENIKSLTKPRGKGDFDDVVEFVEEIKKIRGFITDYGADIQAFYEYSSTLISDWLHGLKKIISFLENNYDEKNIMTFADLEYYTLKSLADENVRSRVGRDFKYVIVDEFQDTSELQFYIIKAIINDDYSRLFCVGDMKQAIYGFRGGELAVYKKAQKLLPQTMKLLNNYRSQSSIVNFNNIFFETLFEKGNGFQGTDDHGIDYDYQSTLEDDFENTIDKVRLVNVLNIKLSPEKYPDFKQSIASLNQIESWGLFQQIKGLVDSGKEDICVLYKKLAPSRLLIPYLYESKISFVAQIKLPLDEDPIISIFRLLLEAKNEQAREQKKQRRVSLRDFLAVTLQAYFNHLNIFSHTTRASVEAFFKDISLWGIEQAFQNFIYAEMISNSNHANNFAIIEDACRLGGNSVDQILAILNKNKKNKYSLDFFVGSEKPKVRIMSTHASKGLEFGYVFLGGIHTNGRSESHASYLGQFPGSFYWKANSFQQKPFHSPAGILEKCINKEKDFSESKRLFYVANTRAKNGIYWCDIQYGDKKLLYGEDSWINGIRVCENELETINKLHINRNEYDLCGNEVDTSLMKFLAEKNVSDPPFFQLDNLGIVSCQKINQVQSSTRELSYFSELSVTRLVTLKQCPRKFYFQNVCQLSMDNLSMLDLAEGAEAPVGKVGEVSEHRSSLERGTFIHNEIAKYITCDFEKKDIDSIKLLERDEQALNFIKEEFKSYNNESIFVSEKQITFQFCGHMIVGIPDLIIFPKSEKNYASEKKEGVTNSSNAQVWDFKTGQYSDDNEEYYFFQLYCYAFALYQQKKVSLKSEVVLNLAYVDEQKIVGRITDYEESKKQIDLVWKKLSKLDEIETSHCQKCQYKTICYFNKTYPY